MIVSLEQKSTFHACIAVGRCRRSRRTDKTDEVVHRCVSLEDNNVEYVQVLMVLNCFTLSFPSLAIVAFFLAAGRLNIGIISASLDLDHRSLIFHVGGSEERIQNEEFRS